MSTPDTTPSQQPAPPAPPAPPATAPSSSTSTPSPRVVYADWPKENDPRPQPWDAKAQGIPATELAEGAPNTVTLQPGHSFPILSGGSQGSFVFELARRLEQLGFPTSVGAGRNPFGVLDDSILSAVQAFREKFNVQEDPTPYGGQTDEARRRAGAHVGPWTWEAIIRATERLAA